MYTILMVVHSILVLFMIVLILLQRTDSDGLGGLGGGGGGNQFMTGRAKANFMTRTTSFLAAAFMITSLALAVMASRMTATSIVDTVTPAATVPKQDNPENPDAAESTVKRDATGEPVEPIPAPTQLDAEPKARPEGPAPAVPKPE